MSAMHEENGTNGAPRNKIFTLAPATDELTFAILDLRRRILQWPKRRKGKPGLGTGDKHFFCHILDLACNKNFNERYGVLVASEASLAADLGVSTRTIHSWKQNICATGEVWMSKKFRPNMWPGDVYHIAVIDPEKPDYQPTRDGMYGAGGTRSIPNAGMGARTPGQPSLPLHGSKSRPATPEPKNEETPIISAESGKKLRLSAEENCGSEPKKLAAESRRNLRLRAEENFGGEPKQFSAESRSNLPPRAEANCVFKRVSVKSKETEKLKGKAPPPVSPLQEWKNRVDDLFPSKLGPLKADLTAKLRSAQTEEAKAEWRARLEYVDAKILGPIPQDTARPKPKTLPIIQRQASADEILEGARYAISVGKRHLLTAEQMEALQKVGELQQPTNGTHDYHK